MSTNLDLLRSYTAQFGIELGPDDEFLPHQPINADDAAELVQKWRTGSRLVDIVGGPEKHNDLAWSVFQQYADDYEIPLDEFLGAVHFVSQHNGAYKYLPRIADQIGCAMDEVTRVLAAVTELREKSSQ
jgi:hypothetical protein